MNDADQNETYERIDDYILGLLAPEQHREIESILENDANYNKYYLQQKELIDLSQTDDVPDPGPEYWEEFPTQVLNNYKNSLEETASQEKLLSTKVPGFYKKINQWWTSLSLQSRMLQTAVALTVVISVSIVLITKTSDTQQYNIVASQRLIWEDAKISSGALHNIQTISVNSYAFSNGNSVNIFSIGQHFALSIAYFFQVNQSQSIKQLSSIESLNLSDTLQPLVASLKSDHTETETVMYLYSNLNTQIEKLLPPDQYALFSAGGWLTNIQIVLATEQYHLLNEINKTDLSMKHLKLEALPKSVNSNFNKLNRYLKIKNHSKKDIYEIEKIITNIKNVLG